MGKSICEIIGEAFKQVWSGAAWFQLLQDSDADMKWWRGTQEGAELIHAQARSDGTRWVQTTYGASSGINIHVENHGRLCDTLAHTTDSGDTDL